jgi:cyclopropane-fatty-acyl-phospholipid synthase
MNANPKSESFADFPDDAPAPSQTHSSFAGRLLRRLLSSFGNPPVEFILWSGEHVAPDSGSAATIKVRIHDRATLLRVLRDPQVQFGEAYSSGRVEVEGDLIQLIELIYRGMPAQPAANSLRHRLVNWFRRSQRNTLAGSRRNIHHHYDIGNEFYALWLGETMAYTCAYYPTADASLEQAQIAKMDHVCRKLQLKPGDSVVEAGCGWGSLALHMASRYGARVRAFNISGEQVAYARERARQQQLDDRVEFIQDDYRNISGHYDVFASVGMLEHVGRENYAELGRVVRRSLGASGRGLIHSIGRNHPGLLHPWITRRIFPGAYAPSLAEMMQIFEPSGLSVLDVENIRLH